jgi:flagellar M-ring protein FliF
MALIRPRVAEEEIVELAGLPEGEERLSLAESEVEDEAMEAARRLENAKVTALQLSDQDMEQAVSVLRGWVKQTQEAV